MRKIYTLILLYFIIHLGVNGQTISYTTLASTYSQNFDGLPSAGPFTITGDGPLEITNANNFGGTVPGWYVQRYTGSGTNISWTISDGSSNTGSAYSYGSTGNSDRALGSLASAAKIHRFGALITNNTGGPIDRFTLTFYTEMWRRGDFATGNTNAFEYKIGATGVNDATGFVTVSNLDMVTPNLGATTNAAANGNAAANRVQVTYTVTGLSWANGQVLAIRWSDANETGADDGLSIDDLQFSANYFPPSTDYFRSVATGNWNTVTTWETSPTGAAPWSAATTIPTSVANTITIQSGHTVTMTASETVDQVVIESSAVLENNMPTSNALTVADGPGADISIQSGGIYLVTTTQAYASHISISAGATIDIAGGGAIQIGMAGSAVGSNNHTYASTSGSFIWHDAAYFKWSTTTTPSIQATFFPDVTAAEQPLFWFESSPSFNIGGAGATVINGWLYVTAPVGFTGTGTKTFRNGIINTSSINGAAGTSGKFIINGTTAGLGGGATIITPTGGMDVGPSTTLSVTASKTVTGNIALLLSSFIELTNYNLTLSGDITGFDATSYVRTVSGGPLPGSLILQNVTTIRTFPVGNSRYNPVTITNGSGHNWAVRVEDDVTPDPPQAANKDKAVWRTWYVVPSTNPPLAGADLTFQYADNDATQIGPAFSTTENNQLWHWESGYWLAAGVAQPPTGPSSARTVSITGWTLFSPFAISNISGPLPVKFGAITATRQTGGTKIDWSNLTEEGVSHYVVERSTDGVHYVPIGQLPATRNNNSLATYSFTDATATALVNYYRIRSMDVAGKPGYSAVARVSSKNDQATSLQVYPNPATGGNLGLQLTNLPAGQYIMRLINISGQQVLTQAISHSGGSVSRVVPLPVLQGGLYTIQVVGNDRNGAVINLKQPVLVK